ncbi:uncharacterized protein [Parasteatoda tepidariorum]|uniref:uncharacterized protein isoform X3 n=1 Tax=Parasteatoda tepidariorum TaxID=114398 RepID=UPI001C71D357|nr:uncharacterized protein LOC107452939 isoform X2 [Parasteatoda tepidariorum]
MNFVPPLSISTESNISHSMTKSRHALLLKKFNETIFERNFLTDVVLEVGDHVYKAHKLVLSCFSHYLKRLLDSEGREPYRLVIPKVGREEIEILLQYMYTGKLNLTCENFFEVYKAAAMLEMVEVTQECIQLLEPKGDIKSCFYSFIAAKKLQNDTAYLKARKHLAHRFEETITSPEFLNFDVNSILELISSQTIGTRSYITAKFLGQENLFRQYEVRKRNFLFEELPMDIWHDHQHSGGINITPQQQEDKTRNSSSDGTISIHTTDCSYYKKSASLTNKETIFSDNHPLQTCADFMRSAKKRYSNVIPAEKESFETAEILDNNYYDSRLLRNSDLYRRNVERSPLKACGPETIHIKVVNEESCAKYPDQKHAPISSKKKAHPQIFSPEKITSFSNGQRLLNQESTDQYDEHYLHKAYINFDRKAKRHQRNICPENELNIEPVHSVVTKGTATLKKISPKSSTFDSLKFSTTPKQCRPEVFVKKQRSTFESKSHLPDVRIQIVSPESLPEKELGSSEIRKQNKSFLHEAKSLDQQLKPKEFHEAAAKLTKKKIVNYSDTVVKMKNVSPKYYQHDEQLPNFKVLKQIERQSVSNLDFNRLYSASKTIFKDCFPQSEDDSHKMLGDELTLKQAREVDEEFITYVLQPYNEDVRMDDDKCKESEVVQFS